jgi:hypothetical protein
VRYLSDEKCGKKEPASLSVSGLLLLDSAMSPLPESKVTSYYQDAGYALLGD